MKFKVGDKIRAISDHKDFGVGTVTELLGPIHFLSLSCSYNAYHVKFDIGLLVVFEPRMELATYKKHWEFL